MGLGNYRSPVVEMKSRLWPKERKQLANFETASLIIYN